ncbi:serine acetyltransferase [soil metagenome]
MSVLKKFVGAVVADFRAMESARARYHGEGQSLAALPKALVTRIGFQMVTAIRAMHALRDAKVPMGAQVASRLIRHAYGAEIHWDAAIAPGVSLVHGNGIVVSHAATIGAGCILFHNVTLGESFDPETKTKGAPRLGRDVHVGPGAVLLGPITIGDGAKIMAGAVVTRSVPAGSVARAAPVEIMPRRSDQRAN